MVWVHGNETRERVSGPEGALAMCSIAFDHDIDRAARVLRYSAHTHKIDPKTVEWVVAFDHWERWSSCPAAYTLHFNEDPTIQRMGREGELKIEVRGDGTLIVKEQVVPLGQRARFTYEATDRDGATTWRILGDYVVENLGAWPKSGLTPH